jgi:hypothetical protein
MIVFLLWVVCLCEVSVSLLVVVVDRLFILYFFTPFILCPFSLLASPNPKLLSLRFITILTSSPKFVTQDCSTARLIRSPAPIGCCLSTLAAASGGRSSSSTALLRLSLGFLDSAASTFVLLLILSRL